MLKYYRYERKIRVIDVDDDNCIIEWRDICYDEENNKVLETDVEAIKTSPDRIEYIQEQLQEQFKEVEKFVQDTPHFYPISDTLQ